ncbi:putative membrane protein [Burkholderia sp. MSHR3999]|nr:putative membrane protein [Burkholderia ubonensis MSMB22]KIP13098.1 putative membrane protein [Burkholderia sp. MSHR3999]
MHVDPSWGVAFKIALHLFFLCVGVALACSDLAEWLR